MTFNENLVEALPIENSALVCFNVAFNWHLGVCDCMYWLFVSTMQSHNHITQHLPIQSDTSQAVVNIL
jgi:hypothetical protein